MIHVQLVQVAWMPCDGGGGNVVHSSRKCSNNTVNVSRTQALVPVQPIAYYPDTGYTRGH